jgi:hypothetical protein
MALSAKDEREFKGYLRQCTDRQVVGVWEKERDAGRTEYRLLAEIEAARRGVDLPR